jgi:hypothetical protein
VEKDWISGYIFKILKTWLIRKNHKVVTNPSPISLLYKAPAIALRYPQIEKEENNKKTF